MRTRSAGELKEKKPLASAMNYPLFTELHGGHSSAWCISGFTLPAFCIACVSERLENKKEIGVNLKKILSESKALLSQGNELLTVLKSDRRVFEKFCGDIYGLLVSQDVQIVSSSMEVITIIIDLAQDMELNNKLLHNSVQMVVKSRSFPSSLPHLTFLGKVLHSNPSLSARVVQNHGHFIDFILGGLSYPDDSVKSAVVYILVQICSKSQQNSLNKSLVQKMCNNISSNLATAKSQELTVNLLGLVRHLLKSGAYTQCLLQADKTTSDAKGSTFASAFRKVLLSSDEVLQLSAVQCVEEVLSHHMDYGMVLLRADIAEFLFEALSSRNEQLLCSLFSCLKALAGADEFYSKCHVLFGIEPIVKGIGIGIQLRGLTAVEMGFGLLLTIFLRKPSDMQIFSTQQGVQKLLDLILPAIKMNSANLVLSCTKLLSELICHSHLLNGTQLNAFYPLLAYLTHLIEPLTRSTSEMEGDITLDASSSSLPEKVLIALHKELLLAINNLNKISQLNKQDKAIQIDEDKDFAFKIFEEVFLPSFLINLPAIDDPVHVSAFFSMTTFLLSVPHDQERSTFLVKILGQTGFVSLVFEEKSKSFSLPAGLQDMNNSGNRLLTGLCCIMGRMRGESESSAKFITDLLSTALPTLQGSAEACLHYLMQKVPHSVLPPRKSGYLLTGVWPESLAVQQQATMLLAYSAYCYGDMLMAPDKLLQALSKYVSLNPSIHLLPPIILTAFIGSFSGALAHMDNTQCQYIADATELIVHGVLKISPAVHLRLSPESTLILWVLDQPALLAHVGKSCFLQWISSPLNSQSEILKILKSSKQARKMLLDLVLQGTELEEVSLTEVVELVGHLFKQCRQEVKAEIMSVLQECLTLQRPDSLPDYVIVEVMKLLKTSLEVSYALKQSESQELISVQQKSIYKVINAVCQADPENGGVNLRIIEQGLNLMSTILEINSTDNQICALILGNLEFLQKSASFISHSCQMEMGGIFSAALHLFACILNSNQLNNWTRFPDRVKISYSSAIASLAESRPYVQVTGLKFWKALFTCQGKTGFIEMIYDISDSENCVDKIKSLIFLILNCLLADFEEVKGAAARCIVEVVHYIEQENMSIECRWIKLVIDQLLETYQSSVLPLIYIPVISAFLDFIIGSPGYSSELKCLAQLLYRSCMDARCSRTDDGITPSDQHNAAFSTCFSKIMSASQETLSSQQLADLGLL